MCSLYEGGESDYEEYVCVVPCLSKSGFGKQVEDVAGYVCLRAYNSDEIKGYNERDGAGKCDGLGMGRGEDGFGKSIEDIYKLRSVCRHYRPWSMGFGAVVPRPKHDKLPTTPAELHDGSKSDPLVSMERRLPFAFEIYNHRAYYQKCAHWESDFGLPFVFNEDGDTINLEEASASICSCTDGASTPYKTLSSDWPENVQYVLTDVWAEYGGIVCNGAKPECPCYTGKWVFCVDEKMCDGMRITADQILELRFWMSNWSSQKDYDDYFKKKPGPTSGNTADETTSDIYTFTHWERLNPTDPNESVMLGMKQNICVPTPLHNKVFDPDIYGTKTAVKYPKIKESYGTHGPGEVYFPTLVREIESFESSIPPLDIIYPYSSKNPWDVIPCSLEVGAVCEHACNQMVLPGPAVGVLGSSVRNKDVFVINTNLVKKYKILLSMLSFKCMDKVPYNKRADFNLEITNLLKQLNRSVDTDTLDGFKFTRTDKYGFFELESVKLKYEQINTLIVICKYDNENSLYTFRVRKVLSKYYGGYIAQREFNYDISYSGDNYLPTGFYPVPTLNAEVKTINGQVVDVFPVHSFLWKGVFDQYVSMSYCINEYTELEESVEKWVQIGASEYIFAEIDNIDLSYLFSFEVIEATLVGASDKSAICGESVDVSIQQATIANNLSVLGRYCIPPNAIILKTGVVGGFRNTDWTLSVKYKFQKLETFMSDDNVVWPVGITDTNESYYRFIKSPFTITRGGSTVFTIDGNHSIGYAVMAYIADSDNRVQSAAATKLLTCVNYSNCRNVDIKYGYTADAVGWELQPNNGFITWRGADRTLSDNRVRTHVHTPLCGDHDCSPSNCIGPMWFPFNNCSEEDYNFRIASNFCLMPIVEGAAYTNNFTEAWRYCQAPDYEAWVGVGGNWAASCGASWKYYYSKATPGSMRFSGYARIRGIVSVPYYNAMQWALPPFGNTGRECTERWLSKDYESYIDLSSSPVCTRAEYMPHVIDDTDIFVDLNCFSRASWYRPVSEPFFHLSQLSLFTATWCKELVDSSTRKRFEDVFDVVIQSPCSYPFPEYGEFGLIIKRYGFKNNNMCWAWQEWWEDINRHSEDKLLFLKLVRPDYIYDYDKKEHRLITDEGGHLIKFIPPKKNLYDLESTEKDYPAIYLDMKSKERYFKIIYTNDEYMSTANVEWMDEDTMYEHGSNPVDGEGGTWGWLGDVWSWISNIGDSNDTVVWAHDVNTLFDADSSVTKNESRKIITGEDPDQVKYFNRGIIATIQKNRLEYLPLLEIGFSGSFDFDYTYTMDDKVLLYNVPIEVTIKGKWGILKNKEQTGYYCLPSVTVTEYYSDDSSAVMAIYYGKNSRESHTKGPTGKLYDYEIVLKLSTLPTHIMKEVKLCTITLGLTPDEDVNIASLSGKLAYYTALTESIQTYERKYITSTVAGEDGISNPDGLNTATYRVPSPNRKSNGQYFPQLAVNTLTQNDVKLVDKMTMVGAGKFYPDNMTTTVGTPFAGGGGTFGGGGASGSWGDGGGVVGTIDNDAIKECGPLTVTVGNLKTVEREEQKKLYEDATTRDDYDVLTLTPYLHPNIATFLSKIGLGKIQHGDLLIKSNKLLWDKHHLVKSFVQDGLEFFTMGGHYFTWSNDVYKTRCMLFGPVKSVYAAVFVHHRHGQSVATATAYEAYVGWVRVGYMEGKLNQVDSIHKKTTGDLINVARFGI